MAERTPLNDNSWLVIPFYTDPIAPGYQEAVSKFGEFAQAAKDVTGLKLAVIDDGSKLSVDQINRTPDFLVSLSENRGKAQALRNGLRALLGERDFNPEFIVQYDGDGDQSFADIPRVLNKLVETAEGDPQNPTLVIGDRYSEELSVAPNPESVAYRQTILMFFGAIANQFGFEGVRDWVSGARGYTKSYAQEFLSRSKSSRYGVEAEQLVLAHLMGAKVKTAPLTESRPRDPWTLTSKWLQNFEVYQVHEDQLRANGSGHVVDVVQTLVHQLQAERDQFSLDLNPLGEDTLVNFTRLGDRYTAEIPAEYRARLFTDDVFPFTIRKTPQRAA